MVATNAVAPRTGNVSAGTSIFAMVVLEAARARPPRTRPRHDARRRSGRDGALQQRGFGARGVGGPVRALRGGSRCPPTTTPSSTCCSARRSKANPTRAACSPTTTSPGSRSPGSRRAAALRTTGLDLNLANVMRAQLYGVFGTLALGMQVLTAKA
jgi:sugar (pentulose or hexulose) kinase